MSGRAFIDTNIFIYLYADAERDKQKISRTVVDQAHECVTSTQILNEISNVMIKKWHMPRETVQSVHNDIQQIGTLVYITEDTIRKAVDLHFRHGFSYYDCLMLASALDSDCAVIYTEDMNNGQIIDDRLKIVNPFADWQTRNRAGFGSTGR
jgi:predicted nucleic acid-binding protein